MRTLCACALLCVALVGCGKGGSARKAVYPVTGKVEMAGGPLSGATVAFGPKEGQPVAIGRTNDEGTYSLMTYEPNDGAAKGEFVVTVMKVTDGGADGGVEEVDGVPHGAEYEKAKQHGAGGAKSGADSGNLVPAKYGDSKNSPLKFTVEEGPNEYNIEIK